MATQKFFDAFISELGKAVHDFNGDTFKVALTNTAPVAATDTVWSTGVYPAPAAANGYSAGGNTISKSYASTGGTTTVTATDSAFTASGGQIGPWRYAVSYNSSKSNKLVSYYDKGGSITQEDGEAANVDFDGALGWIKLVKSA